MSSHTLETFPLASNIHTIPESALPEKVADFFYENIADRMTHQRIGSIVVANLSGVDSYACYIKDVNFGEDGLHLEDDLLLIDTDKEGNRLGYGIVSRISRWHYARYVDKPYVGYTQTDDEFQRRGLGLRRLLIMNHLSQIYFNLPLYSDLWGNTEPEARRVWQKLENQGLAESYDSAGMTLWRFKEV